MSLSVAIGFSQADDPQEAAFQAAVAVKNQFQNEPVDIVLLFTSLHYAKKEVLEAIHSVLKPAKLVGSSSTGIILSNTISNRGIVIIAITSSSLHFGIGSTLYTTEKNSRQMGYELNQKFVVDFNPSFPKQASIIFCDSLIPYENQFVLGAQEIIGQNCALGGAFSSYDFKHKKTNQFYQKQILSHAATGFLIGSSDNKIVLSSRHGFIPLGKPRHITLAEGPIIRTIDNRPAVEIFDEFFKDKVPNLKEGFLGAQALLYPLGIYLEDQRQYLIRYPVDILSDGSIVCQAEVPTNSEVHLMINNKESCRQAACAAALEVKTALKGREPQLVIVFESMIRHKILGRHLFMEVQAIKEILGASTPIVGMYSLGELCHLGSGRGNADTFLQNGSLLILAIG